MSDSLFDAGDLAGEPDPPRAERDDADMADAPLAARLRPRTLDEIVGQAHLVGAGAPLRTAVEADRLRSAVLWGPPGTGKTTLASVIARATSSAFVELSAVTAGVKDVRAAVEAARHRRRAGRGTVLFIDEIHRFTTAQQDALLPGVEDGSVVLVGATTANPYHSVNAPLLSRSLLYRLEPLDDAAVRELLGRAIDDTRGVDVAVTDEALGALVIAADGDARSGLTALEAAADVALGRGADTVSVDDVRTALVRPHLRHDKTGDAHYDTISAFIKSMRGSDPDAAVYWLVRLIEGGEDPRFLGRRMIILASEDIGLADPRALQVAVSAFHALEVVGLPEARFALANAALYLALAPKSNSVTTALGRADDALRRLANAPVPPHLRDAHYKGAADLGHGEGYQYAHSSPTGWAEQRHLPDGLDAGDIYRPRDLGDEPAITAWLAERNPHWPPDGGR